MQDRIIHVWDAQQWANTPGITLGRLNNAQGQVAESIQRVKQYVAHLMQPPESLDIFDGGRYPSHHFITYKDTQILKDTAPTSTVGDITQIQNYYIELAEFQELLTQIKNPDDILLLLASEDFALIGKIDTHVLNTLFQALPNIDYIARALLYPRVKWVPLNSQTVDILFEKTETRQDLEKLLALDIMKWISIPTSIVNEIYQSASDVEDLDALIVLLSPQQRGLRYDAQTALIICDIVVSDAWLEVWEKEHRILMTLEMVNTQTDFYGLDVNNILLVLHDMLANYPWEEWFTQKVIKTDIGALVEYTRISA